MKRRGKEGISTDLSLPPYMEARVMKNGSYSYRVKLKNGSKVNLGWNLQEALTEYQRLRGRFENHDQVASEIWSRHKRGAARRKLDFDLTANDVQAMLDAQAYRCALTQRPFSNDLPEGQRIRPWAASIDRKDATKGYTKANCRLVCAAVNVALNRFGDQAFTELLEALVRRAVRSELHALGILNIPSVAISDENMLQIK